MFKGLKKKNWLKKLKKYDGNVLPIEDINKEIKNYVLKGANGNSRVENII